jgi:transposase
MMGAPKVRVHTSDLKMKTKNFKLSVSEKTTGARIAAGIDVHKYKLEAFILGRFGREDKPLGEQVFGNNSTGKAELCRYLEKYYPDEIVMEKTGKLSDSVYDAIIEHHGWKTGMPRVSVVPPDTIKRFPGEKHTDPNSAYQLARLGISGLFNAIHVTSPGAQQLKTLTRESERYTTQSTALINVMKDMLAGLGYTLPDFTLTSAWGLALLKLLIGDGINGNITRVYELLEAGHVIIHASSQKALMERKVTYLKYSHLTIPPFYARYLQRQLLALEMVEALKGSNLEQIEDTVNKTPVVKERVQAIERVAGISSPGAAGIIAEIDDIKRFRSWRELASYAGRAVAPDVSGEHVGKSRMTKHCNHHLKRIFRQTGITACFSLEEDSDIKRYALRQLGKHPRDKMVACANTSAKIVRTVYKILHDNASYDPFHDTARKRGDMNPSIPLTEKEQTFRLRAARMRAKMYRKFTRRTFEELPQGELKTMLSRVLVMLDTSLK